jgi:tetratricopeptide (TPR) repeat protein
LLEEAATLYGELNAVNPRDVELRRLTLGVFQQLGNMALQRGDADMSRIIYEKYTAIAKAAVDSAPDASDSDLVENLLVGYEGLADAYIELKNPDMTKAYFDKYKQLIESSFTGDKSSAPARHALAVAYGKLGAFRQKLDPTDARNYFQQEVSTLDDLPDSEKFTLESQCDLSQGLGKLALICMGLKANSDAVAAYKRAVEVDENLSQRHPDNQDLRRFALASNAGLGDATLRQGGAEPAKTYYLRARDLAAMVLKADASIDSKLAMAQALRQCGFISQELKNPTDAATYYESARAIDEPLFTSAPENSDAQLGLAKDLFGAGVAARSTGDDKTASASFTRARNLVTPLRAVKSAAGRSADELSKSIDSWLKAGGS